MYERLEDTELSIVDYVAQDQGIAYSNLKESRDKEELSSQTVSRDLRFSTQTQANIIIVAGSPGCNTAIEIFWPSERGPTSTLQVCKGDNID